MLNNFLCWLHDWQDLAAGIIGFAAAIIAVLATWFLTRHQESIQSRNVIEAITAEVILTCNQLTDALEWLTRSMGLPGKNNTDASANQPISIFYIPQEAVIFYQNTGYIGKTKAAYELTNFHAEIEVLRNYLSKFEANHISISPLVPPLVPIVHNQIAEMAGSILLACYMGKAVIKKLPINRKFMHQLSNFENNLQKHDQWWASRLAQKYIQQLSVYKNQS